MKHRFLIAEWRIEQDRKLMASLMQHEEPSGGTMMESTPPSNDHIFVIGRQNAWIGRNRKVKP